MTVQGAKACPRCGTVGCPTGWADEPVRAETAADVLQMRSNGIGADIACSLRAIVARMPTGIGVQTAILNQQPVYRIEAPERERDEARAKGAVTMYERNEARALHDAHCRVACATPWRKP